jgi:hypothetical protein
MKLKPFVKANAGGMIFSVALVVIWDIFGVPSIEYGAGRYIAVSILFIPLVFIMWMIGSAIRRAVHPDVIIAKGFWGLLKEKIFWRVGPQVILSVIALAAASNAAESAVSKSAAQDRRSSIAAVSGGGAGGDAEAAGEADPDSRYLTITREQFIRVNANGNEFTETDAERAPVLIRRGSKYLRVNGSVTRDQLNAIFGAVPGETTENSGQGVFLDMSNVTGWAALDPYDIHKPEHIDTIVLGDEFTEIPDYFLMGSGIRDIYIPDTVTAIGKKAFDHCRQLGGVVIPDSVTSIESTAFFGCDALGYVFFGKDSNLKTIEGWAFYGCPLTEFTIPGRVEVIGDELFDSEITALVYPETIKSIGECGNEEYLRAVTIKSVTPPEVDSDTFPKTIEDIFVPAGSLTAYEDAWFEYEFTFNNQLKAIN